ncbi:MAG: biopolymer transporter Tol [Bacteroidota bacterium]|jgi:Tol biopolymer transport system component
MKTWRALALIAACIVFAGIAAAQDDYYHPELEWHTIETQHFFINFHDGAERTAQVVAKIAEEIYGPVTTLYQHIPDQKVSFVIKDYDDYSNGAAYFFDNKVEIWASALDFDLRGTHNWLRNVVTHEYTHIIQMQTAMKFGRRLPAFYLQWLGYESERRPDVLYGYPNIIVSYPVSGISVPSWFAEGVAQYNRKELGYDSWDSHRDMILRMYALDDKLLTWNEMSVFGKTSLGNESSYNAGFAFVHYIAERYGEDKLLAISQNLASLTETTIDGAIKGAIGKDGEEVYNEWKEYLKKDYAERTRNVKETLAAGEIIADVGFGNFYPAFSPDGRKLAYVSNKEADYFGLSSVYLYDPATKQEKMLKEGVRSTVSWSPDGKKIYYSKTTRKNPHWSNVSDIYAYDIDRDDELRLTYGQRANSPEASPDGKTIVFVAGKDGTLNIFRMNSDGTGIRRLTQYESGEQVYSPKWSPDGKTIVFDYSIKDGRDIATVPSEGGDVTFLLATPDDERNAVFTSDGSKIVFASDKSGIFNLYQYDIATKEIVELTNVLGGAFMPAVNARGSLAFSSYTSTGYKIAMMDSIRPVSHTGSYVQTPPKGDQLPVADQLRTDQDTIRQTGHFDWQSLRSYDDTHPPLQHDTSYQTIASSLSFVPFLRVDNYNPKNKGIDVIKPGLFVYSYDVLERYGFFAGAAMNRNGERDLFFTFDYRGKIPGLFQLGLEPALSFEMYNLTRENNDAWLVPETRPDLATKVSVTYSLLEFDVVLRQKFISDLIDLETRFTHSRYTATIGFFVFQDPLAGTATPNPAFDNLYFIGNDISLMWNFQNIAPSRTMEINPVGTKIRLKYDYEFNKFNPTSDYTISSDGTLVPLYQQPSFHRAELSWRESHRLPGWKHTLSAQLRGGTIFGPTVDDFFDFYMGGLEGMKGYPFYSLGGNQFAYANLTYRFPVLEHIDLRVLQLYFDKLYAAAYGDVGNVWKSETSLDQKFKRDAGVELRLESFSYYAFPTRVFFNATYGFDQFTRYISTVGTNVTYGKEWQFHFGVLFGFDLD